MTFVRCSYCQARRTLKHSPSFYLRIPTCKTPGCNKKRSRLGKPVRYYIDNWRRLNERAPHAPRPCQCGEVYGDGGEYPHRLGSGWCIHNPGITDHDRAERTG